MQEQWRPIFGYETAYEISNFGRVRTIPRFVNTKGGGKRQVKARIRIPSLLNGYQAVNLSFKGAAKMRAIHVMVLESFCGPRPGHNYDACHSDGTRHNNRLDNLRWGTKVENAADAILHDVKPRGMRCGTSKLNDDLVRYIRNNPATASAVALELEIAKSTVNRVRSRRTWAHIE